MKNLRVILAMGVALATGLAAGAQDTVTQATAGQQIAVPPQVERLVRELQERGWSASQLDEFATEASALDWDATASADPEVVALALEYFREQGGDVSGAHSALMARELAGVAAVMHETGFSSLEIGRAALEGTRDAVLDAARAGSDPGRVDGRALGDQLRERVVSRIRDQVRIVVAGRGARVARDVMNRLESIPEFGGFGDEPPATPPGVPGGPDL
jgi:hypothetical protein